MNPYLIAPSILSADFARLGEEVDNVLSAGADVVHFDVMDNHYVPNLTIGPMVCEALRKHGVTAPIDVHLMVSPVDDLIRMFIDAGASYITFHPEASQHIDRSLQLIREGGCKAGLVFNPATPLHYMDHVMDKLDMVLMMSVNPGFGGQKFIPGTLDKLREARKRIDASNYNIRLEIDGGVKADNIREIDLQGQLDNTVWFGQTVVGAPQITLDALIFGITGGQHHYWGLAGFAEPLQHVKTIQFWQQSTQQNNVHPLLQCGNQSLVALIALNDSVPSSG